ncbi:actin-related protein 2/3 complex subunit 5 [Umbelopsis sp. PMI_123]|nr:actin-related protein 2/3 complex subunit 5 [Umbelopsis sp. PMI_123]
MAFRRIDIDQYDEDIYSEDEILADAQSGRSVDEINSIVDARATDVRNLLTRGNNTDALTKSLEDPPYGRNLENAKAKNIKTVIDVLNQFRANDIPTAIKGLNVDQQDVLMKYLYAALAKPEQFNSGMILSWHEKLTEVTGPGSIVRVMTDKRTVF